MKESSTNKGMVELSKAEYIEALRQQTDPIKKHRLKIYASNIGWADKPDALVELPSTLLPDGFKPLDK